ncbi:MAG: tRNA adenosine(34) deaminase TadA [Alphaproteobacteria bacterium]|nr:tRNA adenosine(34) deaminase TadA [Alphaproteobacteria bacterium]
MNDALFMRLALAEAETAQAAGEVPVGAVVVKDGQVIGVGHNSPITAQDPSAHAEMVALRAAARHLGNYRLDGCELFVTLEPCAMCAGAMLHARLSRVVYGAREPRSGAAGSVLNLFGWPELNHHTSVTGGVLAKESGTLLKDFFKGKRMNLWPLRDDALRTPDEAFQGLPDYPWTAHYLNDLPALDGLRMHYLDEGPKDASVTWLCLHGNPAWSYLYRKMIPVWMAAGHRVVAPDMPGFGKSDKPKKEGAHRFEWHRDVLAQFVEDLDLNRVNLVVQDWGGILGLTLPMVSPQRYRGLLVMNTHLATAEAPLSAGFLAWREMCAKNPDFSVSRLIARGNPHMSPAECAAYDAPFPNSGYRAALRAFPPMVPEHTDSPGAGLSRQAAEFWRHQWNGRSLMAVGAMDPVLGSGVMNALAGVIAHCPEPWLLDQAGHFVQEHGQLIAERALQVLTV